MMRTIRPALVLFAAFTLLTGVAYPLLVTGAAGALFAWRAQGSVLAVRGRPVGSALIGQAFSAPRYFWGRPSATSPLPYDALASGGSNLGPTNPAELAAVKAAAEALRRADPAEADRPVPVDLVTASGSGLDPDISLAAANYQLARVARARQLPEAAVRRLLDAQLRRPWLGLFGEPRVNVLELNLALDGLRPARLR
ncbi:potassium-transporting ATPase subunit KdpC [Thiomonas sp.]|jgi:K+-transporting ATPase ATPase C chain|uniref:potassium-transporting ATPase subunit KdpC n=1 Tax=Thiomonas sp. TaxID=2047785 RepID=UPI00262845DF|nr:potassium-transporting ATPase subunit KdpC [Thiomonas sp.]